MRRKYYYYICIPIFCIIFGSSVNAATSTVSTSWTNGGITYSFYTNSYTDIPATRAEYYQDISDDKDYLMTSYDITYPVLMTGLSASKYVSGYINIRINTSVTSGMQLSSGVHEISNTENLRVFMGTDSLSSVFLYVAFDNYYTNNSPVNFGQVLNTYTRTFLNPDYSNQIGSFTSSISIISGSVILTDQPIMDGLAGVIKSSVMSALENNIELDDIILLLTTISNQDYYYYNQILTQLNNQTTQLGNISSNLVQFMNQTDLDFASVQTVLDLFPSYRTLVLQYWQELLQMNASQSSEAAELESDYANKDNQSSTLLSGLGSLNMPSISAGDVDIMANVDTTQKANFFGLIALITNNSLVTTILLIVVTGMIAGYILYGKK